MIALGTDGATTVLGRVSGLYDRLRFGAFSQVASCGPKKATDVFPTPVQAPPVEIFYYLKNHINDLKNLQKYKIL